MGKGRWVLWMVSSLGRLVGTHTRDDGNVEERRRCKRGGSENDEERERAREEEEDVRLEMRWMRPRRGRRGRWAKGKGDGRTRSLERGTNLSSRPSDGEGSSARCRRSTTVQSMGAESAGQTTSFVRKDSAHMHRCPRLRAPWEHLRPFSGCRTEKTWCFCSVQALCPRFPISTSIATRLCFRRPIGPFRCARPPHPTRLARHARVPWRVLPSSPSNAQLHVAAVSPSTTYHYPPSPTSPSTLHLHLFFFLFTSYAPFAPLPLPRHLPRSMCTSSSRFTTCTLSTPLRLSPHFQCAWPWPRVKRRVKSRHGGTAPRGTRRARRVVRHRHAPFRTSQARWERSEEA